MASGFLLALREGLEAALILSVLFGAVNKINRRNLFPMIWGGAAVAAVVSVLAATLLYALGAQFEGRSEKIFEGLAMLVAAVLLTWVIFWMQKQGRSIESELEEDAVQATALGGGRALFFLAFLVIVREGLELVLFLTASAFSSNAWVTTLGAIAGLGAAAFLGVLLFTSTRRLSLRSFFFVTNILLILFAAGLVAHGVHELNEAGLIPPIIEHVWDLNHLLDEDSPAGIIFTALLGYNGNPSLTEVITYIGYFFLVWLLIKKTALPGKQPSQ